jgi:hypothetical protein
MHANPGLKAGAIFGWGRRGFNEAGPTGLHSSSSGFGAPVRFNPSTLQPFNPSTLQPFNPSTLQPFNPSTLQPFNPSTLQPFSASTIPPTTGFVLFLNAPRSVPILNFQFPIFH